jgi:flagellar biosynthesis/type III secretory pathway chaperone
MPRTINARDLRMEEPSDELSWEAEFADLLGELSATQTDLLAMLAEKRVALMKADGDGLAMVNEREEQLVGRLQQCQDRRLRRLSRAAGEGRAAPNLRALARSLSPAQHRQLAPQIDEASRRARTLQHESLTNWVIAQRTLIHLSQLLEIIATGGRLQPTYGGEAAASSGALLNQVG